MTLPTPCWRSSMADEERELDREMWELEHSEQWEALFRPDDGP
jgi:hypothetical protein